MMTGQFQKRMKTKMKKEKKKMTKRKIFLLSLIAVLAVTYIFQLIFASRGKITEVKVKGEIAKIEISNA